MLSNRFFQHICVMFKSFQFIAIRLPVRFPLNYSAVIGTFHLQILPLQFILFFGENHFRNWGQAKKWEQKFHYFDFESVEQTPKRYFCSTSLSLLKLYFTPLKNKKKGEVIEPRNNCYLIVDTVCPSLNLSKLMIELCYTFADSILRHTVSEHACSNPLLRLKRVCGSSKVQEICLNERVYNHCGLSWQELPRQGEVCDCFLMEIVYNLTGQM